VGAGRGGAERALRGGSWNSNARNVRCANRNANHPGNRNDNMKGLRRTEFNFRGGYRCHSESPLPAKIEFCTSEPDPNAPMTTTIDTAWHPLATGCPPEWASAWGQDRYGVWVEFEIADAAAQPVAQCLRWIPPGRFWMGSPEDEPGRFGNEGPRHRVTITRGFWLFDTPCTQALWQAVMGQNPSRFQSPTRPVENVSWEDAQEFLHKLNDQIPDVNLTLPTEAQWEHACRAGTDTATYAGPLPILGANNGPALDELAWYGGNSGVDFELDNGWDSSDWPEKQCDHQRAGTHPVAQKTPNAWGLYDMLGNVYEWCHDGIRRCTSDPLTDPVGPTDGGAERALRGGSWYSGARLVRCADRYALQPGGRRDDFGFRPARVQQ
jgi:formylglycine-generating enzyme required for sulfatase activity